MIRPLRPHQQLALDALRHSLAGGNRRPMLCMPTASGKSEMLYVQIVRRGLRTADGKTDCLILDHSDTTLRLGFVTDIHHTALDDGLPKRLERKLTEPLPKKCPACSYLRPPKVQQCPACGFKPEARSKIECLEGELIELSGRQNKKASRFDKADLYGQLRRYASQRGYSDGWVSHKFRAAFGVWPNAVKDAEEREPTPEVLSWIRSQQIAFAKRRSA